MALHALDHVNIDTTDLEATLAFYAGALGLEHRPKPSGNAGAWLYLGDRAAVHINVVEHETDGRSTGAFNHVAFDASDLEGLVASLAAGEYQHDVSPRPDLGITQIFTTDPNGVAVELNVPMDGSDAG